MAAGETMRGRAGPGVTGHYPTEGKQQGALRTPNPSPSPLPRTLLLRWIGAGRPPWKAHFKALCFKQISVDDSERVGGDRCLQ